MLNLDPFWAPIWLHFGSLLGSPNPSQKRPPSLVGTLGRSEASSGSQSLVGPFGCLGGRFVSQVGFSRSHFGLSSTQLGSPGGEGRFGAPRPTFETTWLQFCCCFLDFLCSKSTFSLASFECLLERKALLIEFRY